MESLLLGAGLGLAAGVSPGPLLALLIASTLQRGLRAGLKVAIAPLLTDLPIILLALLVLRELPAGLLRTITLVGAAFVLYLGIDTLRAARSPLEVDAEVPPTRADLWRGALVNFLNPHPWLFWATVGGPWVIAAWRRSRWEPVLYFAGFYLLIVGSKMVIACLAARGRTHLQGRWYARVLAASGGLLVILALLLAAGAIGSIG